MQDGKRWPTLDNVSSLTWINHSKLHINCCFKIYIHPKKKHVLFHVILSSRRFAAFIRQSHRVLVQVQHLQDPDLGKGSHLLKQTKRSIINWNMLEKHPFFKLLTYIVQIMLWIKGSLWDNIAHNHNQKFAFTCNLINHNNTLKNFSQHCSTRNYAQTVHQSKTLEVGTLIRWLCVPIQEFVWRAPFF